MTDTLEIAEARRKLLEKYLNGDLPQAEEAPVPAPRAAGVKVEGQRESVVPVRASGSKPPFFYLHGDWTGGNAFFCFRLAHGLGADQPFYLLEPYSFDGLPILPTLEEMAAAHIVSMRKVQPEGPYRLGGFCNGGLTAYEMTRQLREQGQSVEVLVLMDSIPPRVQAICAIIRRVGMLLRLSPEKQLDWFLRFQHAYRYLRDRKSDDFEYIKTFDARIDSFFPPPETLRQDYPAMFTWATSMYKATYYAGEVTLFWDEAEPERRHWWDRWAKGRDEKVEAHIIPGTHKTCKTEHLNGMVEHLSMCLDAARQSVAR
jgi:thioesterase domain-containing protein